MRSAPAPGDGAARGSPKSSRATGMRQASASGHSVQVTKVPRRPRDRPGAASRRSTTRGPAWRSRWSGVMFRTGAAVGRGWGSRPRAGSCETSATRTSRRVLERPREGCPMLPRPPRAPGRPGQQVGGPGVVVDLPLVPVIATEARSIQRAARSSSREDRNAAAARAASSGAPAGTPGLRTTLAAPSSACPRRRRCSTRR